MILAEFLIYNAHYTVHPIQKRMLRNVILYTWTAYSWFWVTIPYAFLILPSQALPYTPSLVPCASGEIVSRKNVKLQPSVACFIPFFHMTRHSSLRASRSHKLSASESSEK